MKVESWIASNGKSEQHFFEDRNGEEVYLYGVNPLALSAETQNKIHELVLKDLEKRK